MAITGMPGAGRRSAAHAAGLYRRLFRAAHLPLRRAGAEARHLHAIERKGDADVTPFIAIVGLILFFVPVFLVLLGIASTAYYLG